MTEEGFRITDQDPDFVFVGLNKEATYAEYSKALTFLLQGAKLIGTNQDRILAKPDGFEIGNGSVVAMFEYASNQKSPISQNLIHQFWTCVYGTMIFKKKM